jgi:hypothetical protein
MTNDKVLANLTARRIAAMKQLRRALDLAAVGVNVFEACALAAVEHPIPARVK